MENILLIFLERLGEKIPKTLELENKDLKIDLAKPPAQERKQCKKLRLIKK